MAVEEAENKPTTYWTNRSSGRGRPPREVLELTTGMTFESVKAAAEFYNISAALISHCAGGKANAVKGFTFIYTDGEGRRGANAPVKYAGRGRPLGSGRVRLPYMRLTRKTYDALILAAQESRSTPEETVERILAAALCGPGQSTK